MTAGYMTSVNDSTRSQIFVEYAIVYPCSLLSWTLLTFRPSCQSTRSAHVPQHQRNHYGASKAEIRPKNRNEVLMCGERLVSCGPNPQRNGYVAHHLRWPTYTAMSNAPSRAKASFVTYSASKKPTLPSDISEQVISHLLSMEYNAISEKTTEKEDGEILLSIRDNINTNS